VIQKNRNSFVLFPFLLGIYPVFALIAHNAGEMPLLDGIRSLILSIILTFLFYIILLLIIKNPIKTALITSLFLTLFYSYGHINILTRSWNIFNLSLGRHRVLAPLYLCVLLVGTLMILMTKRQLSTLTRFLNVFGVILLIFPIYQIAAYQVQDFLAQRGQKSVIASTNSVSLPPHQAPRDVYYILTDGYPRQDFIAKYLGYDNTDFVEELTSRDFFVAQCSQSNYTDTRFAMASTLNMTYLDNGTDLPEVMIPGSDLDIMIRSGAVQQNFSSLGYKIITFESGYKWLRWENTDVHLDPAIERSRRTILSFRINNFENLLLNTTAMKLILDLPFVLNPDEANKLAEIINSPRASHSDRVFFTLKELPIISESINEPIFVYAHIIFPHPPFIVGAAGNSIQNSPPNELSAYADQIAYLNYRLLDIVDELIETSDPDPIIIIQGDHGATIEYEELNIDKSNRLGILNAYYLPNLSDGATPSVGSSSGEYPSDQLYSTITPVNTFRLIFDQYYNGNYGLLDDKSIVGRQSPFITLECPISGN
jgi:hypothetical protein